MARLLDNHLDEKILMAGYGRPFFLCMALLSLSIMAMIIFVCGDDSDSSTSGKKNSGVNPAIYAYSDEKILMAGYGRPFFLFMDLLSLSIMAMIIFVCGDDSDSSTSGKKNSGVNPAI
ncbi:Uncharacterized protein Fot_40706 [Forsythia ovata]|uniref:NADH dehydrogenase subunit 6 n=1 Tax=Forsythia ovata TaxID=205694 RepID=A0ABD1S9R8_9LAMI